MSAPNASTPPTLARSLSPVSGAEWVAAAGIVGIGVPVWHHRHTSRTGHPVPVPVDDRIVFVQVVTDPILGVYDARRLGRRAGCQHFGPLLIVAVVVLTAVVVARRIRSRPGARAGGHCPASADICGAGRLAGLCRGQVDHRTLNTNPTDRPPARLCDAGAVRWGL